LHGFHTFYPLISSEQAVLASVEKLAGGSKLCAHYSQGAFMPTFDRRNVEISTNSEQFTTTIELTGASSCSAQQQPD